MGKMSDQLQKALAELAQKLGTTAEHLWGVLMRQARVEIITDCMAFVGAIILVLIVIRYWFWFRDNHDEISDSLEMFSVMGGVVVSLFTLIITVVSIVNLFDLPTLIFNPEYWALSQIRGLIK